jgi:hypothetical protein
MPPPSQNDGDPLAPHSLSAAELKELLAAEGGGSPFLAYRDELGLMRIFSVPSAERPFMVGRNPDADLAIPWDGEVSGIHAELRCFGGEVTVADDGLSTNGTYVNEQRVMGRVRLRDRDRLRLGRTPLAFRSGSRSAALATVAAKDAPSLLRLTDLQKGVLVSLCRPLRDGATFATPATNQEIASEVYLTIDAVKVHLRNLFAKFDLTELPQNQKRARLAEAAMRLGLVTERDLL